MHFLPLALPVRHWAPLLAVASLLLTSPAGAAPARAAYAPIDARAEETNVPAELELYAGESRVFAVPGMARVAVGNPGVLTADDLGASELIVFAGAPGATTLTIWHHDGRTQRVKIVVNGVDMRRTVREINAFLGTIAGARSSVVGDKVIVEGDELSDADREKLAELAKRYPQIVNFTSAVTWEQMVRMDVTVAEFPKSALREMGLKWSAAGGAAFGAVWNPGGRAHPGEHSVAVAGAPVAGAPPYPTALTALSGINVGLGAQLALLEQEGRATVLAQPQLSARSGARASFLAGGELPYSVASVNGVTMQFKPYGIRLEVEPRVGRNGIVRAIIDAEVSSIDASLSTPSGPALLSRRTRTEFNVRQGETIVLSGLLQRSTGTDVDKLPLLGDLPVLGALFRSRRFQNKETELVVFVTPTVVDGRDPAMAAQVAATRERLQAPPPAQ